MGALGGGGSMVKLSAPSLSFGKHVYETASSAKSVTITNGQSGPLTISGTNIDNGDFLPAGGSCSGAIAPNAVCTILLTFTPSLVGNDSATLTFNADAPVPALSLRGTGLPPVELSPRALFFGKSPVGSSLTKTVTVTNNQAAALAFSQPPFVEYVAGAGGFAITNRTCGARLQPRQSCSIGVTFRPARAGPADAFLDIYIGSGQRVSLNGTGT